MASTSATPLASSSLGGSSSNSPRLTLSEALKEKLVELDVGQQVRLPARLSQAFFQARKLKFTLMKQKIAVVSSKQLNTQVLIIQLDQG